MFSRLVGKTVIDFCQKITGYYKCMLFFSFFKRGEGQSCLLSLIPAHTYVLYLDELNGKY